MANDETLMKDSKFLSLSVNMKFEEKQPPPILFHGTAEKNIDSIFKQGLIKGNKQYVHLSKNREIASKIGKRHGNSVVLVVQAGEMHKHGHKFFFSKNDVWLVDWVPTNYLSLKKNEPEYNI